MNLLKIDDGVAQFLGPDGAYLAIDKITKEDVLRLVNATLDVDDATVDEYDEKAIKNQAHQIIYKNVSQKLKSLRERRQEFKDQSARLFLADYEKYKTK